MHTPSPHSRALFPGLCLGITLAVPSCAAEPRVVSQTVIISYWDHAQPDASGSMPGLDLDAQMGTARTSRCDDALDGRDRLLGEDSVDNQYAMNLLAPLEDVTPMHLAPAITEQLVRGEHLYGFEIEADATDPNAPITIALVRFDATDLPLATSEGRLAAGARVTTTRLAERVATREHGTLLAHFDGLDVPMGDVLETSRVDAITVRLVIDGDGRVRHGDLGGAVTVETVLEAIDAATGTTGAIDLEVARALAQPDLSPNADGSICSLVSFGVGLELVAVDAL